MKQYTRITFLSLFILSITYSCVKLDFSEKIPGLSVTLNTDWSLRGENVDIPSDYIVYMNNEEQRYDKHKDVSLPDYPYGDYFALIYNPAEKVTVEGYKSFIVDTNEDLEVATDPEWLFTSSLDVLYDETSRSFTAVMKQQMRQLNIIVSYTGENDPIDIECNISGVASELELDFENGDEKYKKSSIARTLLNKNEDGDFVASMRLFGIVPSDIQVLNLDIAVSPDHIKNINENISELVEKFNVDKHIPLTLVVELDDSFDPIGNSKPKIDVHLSIEDWVIE